VSYPLSHKAAAIYKAGIFKKSIGARNRAGIGLCTSPPGYIGWQNSFLGVNSWAP
jgi:hypothetical protein